MTLPTLTIGQSADPDDAFMVWALANGEVELQGFEPSVRFSDIQTLNEWALDGRLEVTALSAGAYPLVADRYRLLRCGASFGEDYGPVVVGRDLPHDLPRDLPHDLPRDPPHDLPRDLPRDVSPEFGPQSVQGLRIGVPGLMTTAYMLLQMAAGDTFEAVPMAFDRILEAVVDGSVDAGLIIHEGQLTFRDHGLHTIFEPAKAWHRDVGLPVPLGVVAVRRDLGEEECQQIATTFRKSIDAALAHPVHAFAFAAEHARGLDEERLQTFVDQYVNEATRDMGDQGLEALRKLYGGAQEAGLLDEIPPLDLLG